MGLLAYAKFFTSAINGANGWINLKVISIQPSEICKLYLVMFLANLFANYTAKGKNVFCTKKAYHKRTISFFDGRINVGTDRICT